MNRSIPILSIFLIYLIPLLGKVDFNREVRPLLASKCYACHGPDEEGRKAKLRLDIRESTLKNDVIVPGEVEDSEFHYRIHSDDPDEIMPPPESHATLTQKEKELLDQWIKEGAKYAKHWGFVTPTSPPVPEGIKSWTRNPIDSFISENLKSKNFTPSEEADKYSLVRRLYLDLIGLPPTPEQADAFVFDNRPDAYQKLIDQLIASNHYGEKWGREWLDLARYADTNGYEKDRPREIWHYRDWVIRAINADMPYDQFTIEQLAGDMLSNATLDQKIATGFHRNTQLNEEGGIDPLEFRFHAAVDRVATTGTVWMGLTTGCAQCHTHKYDPITHDEYFGIMALLDNVEEPDLFLITEEQKKLTLDIEGQVSRKVKELIARHSDFEESFLAWQNRTKPTTTKWNVLEPTGWNTNLPKLELMKDGSIFASGDFTKRDVYDLNYTSNSPITALRIEALPDDRLPGKGPGRSYYEGRSGTFFLSEVTASFDGLAVEFSKPSSHGGNGAENILDGDGSSGWSSGNIGTEHHLILPLSKPIPARQSFSLSMLFERHFVAAFGRFRISATSSTKPIKPMHLGSKVEDLIAKDNKTPKENDFLKQVFLEKTFLTQKENNQLFGTASHWIWDEKNSQTAQTLYFSKTFELPEVPKSGRLAFTCDDESEFFINGKEVASNTLWNEPVSINLNKNFVKGRNTIAVKATNNGGPGALIAQLNLVMPKGKKQSITSDNSWLFTKQKPVDEEWKTKGLSNGQKPQVIGKPGDAPWKSISVPLSGKSELAELKRKIPQSGKSLVMQERPADNPRATFLRHRGEYSNPKHKVPAGIPEIFGLPVDQEPSNRLEFARWLVSENNPIGDRVVVNRAWRSLFGAGLIRTNGDFGTQSAAPDHPELLDWLAVEFRKSGMSLKKLHRLIVNSSTYRQSSETSDKLFKLDPQNRLLTRGPRFRLTGELIRDHMLFASGKLSSKMFGPGVYPPQPESVLSHAFGNKSWNVSKGEDRYRRSIYTFIKRTAPFAGHMTFDGSSGENCMARRDRSNTPLQALTLLNDEMFLELARVAGKEIHQQKGDAVHKLFRRFLTRPPSNEEKDTLQKYLNQQIDRLNKGELKAAEITAEKNADSQWAGKVLLARAIMNLDESITKP